MILVISEHLQFGWKLSLHYAREEEGGSVYIQGIPEIKEEIGAGRSPSVIELIRTVGDISDEALIRAYSREKDKTKIAESTITNLIRPRIERSCPRIIKLAQENQIPVYFRGDFKSKGFSDFNRIHFPEKKSRCLFHFIRNETGLRYFISLSDGEQEISLQQKRALVLSDNPCIVVLGDRIHEVEDIDSKKLLPFFSKTHIEVPSSAEKAYIRKFVAKQIPLYETRIEGIPVIEKNPEKRAILTLEEGFGTQLTLSLLFEYDRELFFPTGKRGGKIVRVEESDGRDRIIWFSRDIDWERGMIDRLKDSGLGRNGDNQFYISRQNANTTAYSLVEWMNAHNDDLAEFVVKQKTPEKFYSGKIELYSKLWEKIDWFDLEAEVLLDNFRIPFRSLRDNILNRDARYPLPDQTTLILPESWFDDYHDLFQFGEESGKGLRLKKSHFTILNDSVKKMKPENWNRELERFSQTPLILHIPSERLNKILRPYQKQGFYWLRHLNTLGFGGCLADDMGLGKTLQTITLLDSLYSGSKSGPLSSVEHGQYLLFAEPEQKLPPSLIVVPTSLLHNWKNELEKFSPDLRVYIHSGAKRLKGKEFQQAFRSSQIILTSYGTLRADIEELSRFHFHYLILDESQYIKNPDSATYQAVCKLHAPHRVVLTGTPIENSLTDLWAQFNFINPGLLGNSDFFREQYTSRIHKDETAGKSLLKLIRPFLLRRTKEEVTPELPPLSEEIVYCDMTEDQEELYRSVRKKIREHLLEEHNTFTKNKILILQGLMQLRLLSNHPVMVQAGYSGESGKFNQVLLYFESIRAGGHKVLIFSSFVKTLKLLAARFDEQGWKYALLTGQTRNREEEIERFNCDPEINCFFISLKAGGTGLNLTAADYVFLIDPWWNPATEAQALSRAHRIGQNRSVMAYRFISSASIEEKILLLQERKRALSESLVGSNNPLNDLEEKEIEDLFDD